MSILDCTPYVVGLPVTLWHQCSRCGEFGGPEKFNHNSKTRSKLSSWCRDCTEFSTRRYRANNPDKVNAAKRNWNERNREKVRKQQREAAKRNRTTEKRKVYLREYQKHYSATEHGKTKVRLKSLHYSARKAQAEGSFTPEDIERIKAGQTDKQGRVHCWWCGKVMTAWQIDHIVALNAGGSNKPENLCLACKPCNSGKCDKSISEWAGRLL
jgi:hypothetical protein